MGKKKKKEKKQVEVELNPRDKYIAEMELNYGTELRAEASFGAILNYIAGTNDYTERDALWEFARKKRDGEYPWGDPGGIPGPPGPEGPRGPRGYSAYEIAVQEGFTGTEEEWLASLEGEDGENGQDGTNGEDGKGWTYGEYHDHSGKVEFYSADGLGFETSDLRGADGQDSDVPGPKGDDGKGWTGGSYNPDNGKVTFASDDGLGFVTGDLRGEDGEDGEDSTVPGPPGDAATITVGDVEQLNPGVPPYVTNVGDEQDAIFNFGLPKGEKGSNGTNGADGASIHFLGVLEDMDALGEIIGMQPGDLYIVDEVPDREGDYHGYVWNVPPQADPPAWTWIGPWQGPKGDPGSGGGVPPGGTTNQVLTKLSDTDGDADWRDPQGGDGKCAQNYNELRDCAPTGGGGGGCYGSWKDLVDCTPSDGGGGGCFETYGDQKNCSPSDQDHLVLLDDAARPTKYVGKGRPDIDMPGTGNEGDTYICVEPDGTSQDGSATPNLGAREWRYTDGEWVCVEGRTEAYTFESVVEDSPNSPTTGWYMARREGDKIVASFWYTASQTTNTGTALQDLDKATALEQAGWMGYDTVACTVGNSLSCIVSSVQKTLRGIASIESGYVVSFSKVVTSCKTKKWPSELPDDGQVFAVWAERKIETLAEENPELADQLREELKALEADNG